MRSTGPVPYYGDESGYQAPWGAWWALKLYPDAAEAIAIFRSRGGNGEIGARLDSQRGDATRVAARRAGTKVRRYCAANRLNRLGTLTYRGAGCHDVGQLRVDLGEFFRRLRRARGGFALPYLWVGEWHPGGHGLHAHFGVERYIARSVIEECWPHGFVHIKLLGDLPAASTALTESRVAARYLSKYVVKAFGEASPSGRHRYEVAQGFAPEVVRFHGETSNEVIADAVSHMGCGANFVLPSSEWKGYGGPPAVFLSWM